MYLYLYLHFKPLQHSPALLKHGLFSFSAQSSQSLALASFCFCCNSYSNLFTDQFLLWLFISHLHLLLFFFSLFQLYFPPLVCLYLHPPPLHIFSILLFHLCISPPPLISLTKSQYLTSFLAYMSLFQQLINVHFRLCFFLFFIQCCLLLILLCFIPRTAAFYSVLSFSYEALLDSLSSQFRNGILNL